MSDRDQAERNQDTLELFGLLFQPHPWHGVAIGPQHAAQDVTELRDHVDRASLVAIAHERADRVQRVEEEVRVELHPQRAQLCLRKLGLHRQELARARAVRGRKAEPDGGAVDDEPVGAQVDQVVAHVQQPGACRD